MFVFIIPLISPEATRDWNIVSKRCNNTLRSILRQKDKEFRVILVCNKPPINCISDSRLEIITDSYITPETTSEKRKDLRVKIKRGLIETRKYAPAYIMRVDADDYVSNRIVRYARNNNTKDGWVIRSGYFHQMGNNYLIINNTFNSYCGTSTIIKVGISDLPKNMNSEKDEYIYDVWKHQGVVSNMKKHGKIIEPLPFAGSIYNVGHSDNILGSSSLASFSLADIYRPKRLAWKMIGIRPMTEYIAREFGVRPL